MTQKPLFTGAEWTIEQIEEAWTVIDSIGQELGLKYYRPSIEIISAEQMLDCYSSHAMPVLYEHWSFGKSFIQDERKYLKGEMGLAYEVVINTDPCIAYLLDNNTMTMQTLVMSHAVCGHGSFFKNNYLFKEWTDAQAILPYLTFARDYIKDCEVKYGVEEVESLLDACHSIQHYGVDKYKRPPKLKKELQMQRQRQRQEQEEEEFNDLWRTVPKTAKAEKAEVQYTRDSSYGRDLPEENLLYFIEKKSPILKTWQREIVRIVRKISQYFYPQYQTKLMNEGWATFVHYKIMGILYERGHITEGNYLEFLMDHTAVACQHEYTHDHYHGINVYALGFAIFKDIERMCVSPTEEDLKYFPQICNTDPMTTLQGIVEMYKDESFILQWMSPKVVRDFKLFNVENDSKNTESYTVGHTHSDEEWQGVRDALAANYSLQSYFPKIEVTSVDWEDDRTLNLSYTEYMDQELDFKQMKNTLDYIQKLWGHNVFIGYYDIEGNQLP